MENRPNKQDPIRVEEETGVETWKAENGITFEHNTCPKNPDYFAKFTLRRGRYRFKIIHSRKVIPAEEDKIASQERVFENTLLQLEQGVKRGEKWENVRITFRPDDLRVIDSLIEGIREARDIFDASNPREAAGQ